MEEKDDILEQQIKFREEMLRQYVNIIKTKRGGTLGQNPVIDHALEELNKLYKLREKKGKK